MNKMLLGLGTTAVIGTAICLNVNEVEAASLPNLYVTTGRVNCRSNPSVSKGLIYFKIPSQEIVEVVEYNKNYTWARVEYNNCTGWVSMKYLKAYEDDLVPDVKTTANLNLRTEPNTTTGVVIKTLPKGTNLIILEQRDNWLYVKPLDGLGTRGWVSARWVK